MDCPRGPLFVRCRRQPERGETYAKRTIGKVVEQGWRGNWEDRLDLSIKVPRKFFTAVLALLFSPTCSLRSGSLQGMDSSNTSKMVKEARAALADWKAYAMAPGHDGPAPLVYCFERGSLIGDDRSGFLNLDGDTFQSWSPRRRWVGARRRGASANHDHVSAVSQRNISHRFTAMCCGLLEAPGDLHTCGDKGWCHEDRAKGQISHSWGANGDSLGRVPLGTGAKLLALTQLGRGAGNSSLAMNPADRRSAPIMRHTIRRVIRAAAVASPAARHRPNSTSSAGKRRRTPFRWR